MIASKGEKIVAKRQSVSVGARQDGMIEVLSGLSSGDKIIADGLNRVQPDQAIKLAGAHKSKSGKRSKP
jgi:multidrug efflux pump subunit AcrA (membrane-fusion protein)